jgi:triacylglycerol lipase
MVIRISRALLMVQIIVALALAGLAVQSHDMPVALAIPFGVVCVVAARLLITANNFLLAWRFGSPTPPEFRISALQALRLFFGEYAATMTTSSWTMPFKSFSTVRRGFINHVHSQTALPVLLVHGYGCNSGYWHGMSKTLSNAGITHYAVSLEPVDVGIDDYADLVHAGIALLCRECRCDKIIIVAHSMGGLATRAYLRKHGAARVARAITLGTPHHGTALARFGLGLNTQQMLWKENEQEGLASEWLRQLASEEDNATRRLFVSLYSHHDNIIAPQTSSILEGARNVAFGGVGHVALAGHPAIQARVIEEIRAASTQHRAGQNSLQ